MPDGERKGSKTHPARTLVCEKCGESFVAYHKRSLCPECYAKARKEYLRDYARRRAGKAAAKDGGKPSAAAQEAEATAAPSAKTAGEPTRCLFCGAVLLKGGQFCKTCLREGFNNVYEVTGRSNGWDRKPSAKVKIVSGWRGQGVIGGCRPSSGLEPRGW